MCYINYLINVEKRYVISCTGFEYKNKTYYMSEQLENGQYINDFPQPLTSFRAETLISQSGSMSSRFYH